MYIDRESTDAGFHFAVEEFFMRNPAQDEPVFMLWRADRCVMLGRNQIAEAEVDARVAKEAQVRIVRRSSGGGAIFTDLGTLQYTLIVPLRPGDDARTIERQRLAGPMLDALRRLGVPASLEGRNDLLLDGKKISGLAQWTQGGRLCSHGSLLYDTDLSLLERVLRVDEGKIRSKAVASLRSRVANLSEFLGDDVPLQDFRRTLADALPTEWTANRYEFTATELEDIERIRREKYDHPDWTFGKTPPFQLRRKRRYPGGTLDVFLDVCRGVIRGCRIRGDFLALGPVEPVERVLEDTAFQPDAVRAALRYLDLRPCLGTLTAEQVADCLFEET